MIHNLQMLKPELLNHIQLGELEWNESPPDSPRAIILWPTFHTSWMSWVPGKINSLDVCLFFYTVFGTLIFGGILAKWKGNDRETIVMNLGCLVHQLVAENSSEQMFFILATQISFNTPTMLSIFTYHLLKCITFSSFLCSFPFLFLDVGSDLGKHIHRYHCSKASANSQYHHPSQWNKSTYTIVRKATISTVKLF